MSLISRITTWTVNQILTSSALNGEFNNIVNLLNNIDAGTTNFSNCNSTASTITTATVTTLANTIQKYRRPVLQYSSGTVVILETGINGTSGQLGIIFPDGSYRTDSTTTRIQCNTAQVAALTSTAQSGLRTGTVAANTWYAVYAVKSQVNTTDIVAVADTVLPLQANYATLNTNFGTNGWVYVGLVRNGDNSGTTNAILSFAQAGSRTYFTNTCTGNAFNMTGTRLATSAGATSLTYSYSAGTGATAIPNNITNTYWGMATGSGGAPTTMQYGASAGSPVFGKLCMNTTAVGTTWWSGASLGVQLATPNVALDIFLGGFDDGVLGVGSSPLL